MSPSPSVRASRHRKIVLQLFGSLQARTIVAGFCLIVLLGVLTNLVYELLRNTGTYLAGTGLPATWVSSLNWGIPAACSVVFLAVVWRFWSQARHASADETVVIDRLDRPTPNIRVLIVLLSPAPRVESIEELAGPVKNEALRRVRGSWQMPLESIEYVAITLGSPLELVVVVPSKESRDDLEGFRQLVESVFSATPPKVRVCGLHEILSGFDGGVDFEDAQQVNLAVNAVFDGLGRGISPGPDKNALGPYLDEQILVDITGGKKPTSVGAALVIAVKQGCRFLYISTTDYTPRIYNPIYRIEE